MHIDIMNEERILTKLCYTIHNFTNCFIFLIAEEAIYMIIEKRGSIRGKENLGAHVGKLIPIHQIQSEWPK